MNFRYVMYLVCFVAFMGTSCKSHQAIKKPTSRTEKRIRHLNETYGLNLDKKAALSLYDLIEEWMGVPHKDNGCSKTGTDCSCFIKMVYAQIYQTDVGKHSQEMYSRTQRIEKSELREGDLVFFKTKGEKISHVGIYLNNNKFAHVSSSKGVAINSLEESYYLKTYTAAGRKPD